jgi:MFS family permease
LEPADPYRASKINGETSHDRATDAEGRLENHLPAVPVHAGELCRQDRGRPCRRADHGRAEALAGAVRLLGSSFFFLFSISAIVVGFIVNRVDTRWVLLAMAVIWSVAQFPMVGTVSFTTLLICRIILGAGEGPAFRVAAHAIYKWFPDEKRTLPPPFSRRARPSA